MWETGQSEPSTEMCSRLAELLGCSVGYLMGTEDEINAQRRLAELHAQNMEYMEKKLDALISQSDLPSNVRPISSLHRQRVPLIGSVAAGEPIYDPEELGVYVDSPVEADAAITIRGDSMIPTYQDGDLVYIKARPDVPEGAVAVVFLDDEATLKHVYKRPTGLTLISDNMETHPPIMVEFEDYANVRIFGVPVGYTRIYKPGIAGKVKKGFK
jgi:repressor LexA